MAAKIEGPRRGAEETQRGTEVRKGSKHLCFFEQTRFRKSGSHSLSILLGGTDLAPAFYCRVNAIREADFNETL